MPRNATPCIIVRFGICGGGASSSALVIASMVSLVGCTRVRAQGSGVINEWKIKVVALRAKHGAVLKELTEQMQEELPAIEVAWLLTHALREILFEIAEDERKDKDE